MVSPFLGLAVFLGRTVFYPLPFLGLRGLGCASALFPWFWGLGGQISFPFSLDWRSWGLDYVSARSFPWFRGSVAFPLSSPLCLGSFFFPWITGFGGQFPFLHVLCPLRFRLSVRLLIMYGFLPFFLDFAVSGFGLYLMCPSLVIFVSFSLD